MTMSGSNERKKIHKGAPKEKVLQIYDRLFQGQDITQGRAEFWNDFFLLKVNLKCLTAHFEKMSVDDLICLKPQLNRLFSQCLLTAQTDRHRIRIVNSVQTMDALIMGVYKCKALANANEELSEFLISSDCLNDFIERYISLCFELIREDRPEQLRTVMLNSLLTFSSVSTNLNSNPFVRGLLDDRIFDLIHSIMINPQLRYHHGVRICKLLAVLLHTDEGKNNLFHTWICQIDDELLLNGVSSTVTLALSDFNLRFRQQHENSGGFFSSFSSFFSNLVSGDVATNVSLRPCDSFLLCLLELAKNSTHFTTFLSYSNGHCIETRGFDTLVVPDSVLSDRLFKVVSTESIVGFLPAPMTSPGKAVPVTDSSDSGRNAFTIPGPESRSSSLKEDYQSCGRNSLAQWNNASFGGDFDLDVGYLHTPMEPRNLLADLLEYCSIIMQDVKTTEALNSSHLCLIIILCMTQNHLACALLHDSQTSFKVRIHKRRSQKSGSTDCNPLSCQPIALAILDLIVEFARGHLMTKLPYRLYQLCLSICHNLLCYQKMHNIRLEVVWKHLWSVILNLLKFVLNLDNSGIPLTAIFGLTGKALRIFNFFILHGDSFLQTADVYDNLYYELIRMHKLIESIYEYSLKHANTASLEDVKSAANDVVVQLFNLRAIANHFNAKIAAFSTANNVTTLTENQVLDVVRGNYDTLTLRFIEELDTFDQYIETVEEAQLFRNIMELITRQLRKDCMDSSLQLQIHLNELSSIPP